jgi:hypothetical protein
MEDRKTTTLTAAAARRLASLTDEDLLAEVRRRELAAGGASVPRKSAATAVRVVYFSTGERPAAELRKRVQAKIIDGLADPQRTYAGVADVDGAQYVGLYTPTARGIPSLFIVPRTGIEALLSGYDRQFRNSTAAAVDAPAVTEPEAEAVSMEEDIAALDAAIEQFIRDNPTRKDLTEALRMMWAHLLFSTAHRRKLVTMLDTATEARKNPDKPLFTLQLRPESQ